MFHYTYHLHTGTKLYIYYDFSCPENKIHLCILDVNVLCDTCLRTHAFLSSALLFIVSPFFQNLLSSSETGFRIGIGFGLPCVSTATNTKYPLQQKSLLSPGFSSLYTSTFTTIEVLAV